MISGSSEHLAKIHRPSVETPHLLSHLSIVVKLAFYNDLGGTLNGSF